MAQPLKVAVNPIAKTEKVIREMQRTARPR